MEHRNAILNYTVEKWLNIELSLGPVFVVRVRVEAHKNGTENMNETFLFR